MKKELELGNYEFHPNEKNHDSKDRHRIEWLMEELIYELKLLRKDRELPPEYTDEELEQGYKAMAEEEAANPDWDEWVESDLG